MFFGFPPSLFPTWYFQKKTTHARTHAFFERVVLFSSLFSEIGRCMLNVTARANGRCRARRTEYVCKGDILVLFFFLWSSSFSPSPFLSMSLYCSRVISGGCACRLVEIFLSPSFPPSPLNAPTAPISLLRLRAFLHTHWLACQTK